MLDPSSCSADASMPSSAPATERQLAELLQARRTVPPEGLGPPGPDREQLERILGAAAAAPDHGGLVPWRFVIVPQRHRTRLADVFVQSLQKRDGGASPDQRGQAREEAFRAPVLMLAIARLGTGNGDISLEERIVSAGCAIQNMLLMATVQGYGSALTTGTALKSAGVRALFALDEHEEPLGFISLGCVASPRAGPARPVLHRYVSELGTG